MAFALDLAPGFHPVEGFFDTTCVGFGDPSSLGSNAKILKEPPRFCSKPCERGPKLYGIATGFCSAVKRCMCSAHNALCNRHGTKQVAMTRDFLSFRKYWPTLLDEVGAVHQDLLPHWDWFWWVKWPAGKLKIFAYDRLNRPFLPDRVASFVKFELYTKIMKKARLIQGYFNTHAQSEIGPECSSLQKAYAKVLYRKQLGNTDIRITFASGFNSEGYGRWLEEVLMDRLNPVYYERDGASWDASMQRAHHEVKMLAYSVATQQFRDVIEQGFKVVGHVDMGRRGGESSYMKYELAGTTKSGHNDTTLGNSIVNAAIAFEAMVAQSITGDIIVAGDDLLVVVDGDFDEHALAAYEAGLGIKPEFRKFYDYRHVSFVSGIWVERTLGKYAFIPKPGRQMQKLFWSVNHPTAKTESDYIHSIVTCLRPVCGQLPVMGAFLDAHERPGRLVNLIGKFYLFREVSELEFDSQLVLREFCRRYQTDAAEVAEVEVMIRSLTGRRGILKHPLLDRMVFTDTCDLSERPTP